MFKNVLILGSFSAGALEHQYVRGFLNHGWHVETLEIQLPVHESINRSIFNKVTNKFFPNTFLAKINYAIIQKAKMIKPNVILIFKGMEIQPETILELKTHGKLIINYNPDHPFNFFSKGAGNKNVLNSIMHYDLYFSYSTSICNQLIEKFNIKSYCIPFGYDETIKPKKNISTIFDQFLFIGAWDTEREHKLKELSSNLQIFGPSKWAKKISNAKNLTYNTEPLYEQKYANACLSASGILNFLRPQNILEQSHNMRTFEVPGYGGLLIAERTDEQLAFFKEDREAIYFNGITELNDKLTYLYKHPNVIANLKKNAFARATTSGYDYNSRTQQFINYIEKHI